MQTVHIVRATRPAAAPGSGDARASIDRAVALARFERQWPQRRLCFVSAPAGYGKSTLLLQMRAVLAAREVATAWVALDEAARSPAKLIGTLAAALEQAAPGVGRRALALVQAQGGQPTPPPAIAAVLLEGLAQRDVPLAVFVDDTHFAGDGAALQLLFRLVAAAPPALGFVLASRALPPAEFAQWRLRGDAFEIGRELLAFTREELALLCRTRGVRHDAAFVERLHASTEGWAAGVQLLFLAAEDGADPEDLLAAWSGRDRSLVDYLGAAVLARQDEATREFLLACSVLERLEAGVCTALGAGEDSQLALQRIEEAGLFLIALDRQREAFRFHHLFGEYLRAQLAARSPSRVALLRRRASAWYEAQNRAHEAIHYAFAAEDFETAARLTARHAFEVGLYRGEHALIFDWVKRLPPQLVAPELRGAHAWAYAHTRQPAAVQRELDALTGVATFAGGLPVELFGGAALALADAVAGNSEAAHERATRWVARWNGAPDRFVASVSNTLAFTCGALAGDHARGLRESHRAREAFERCQAPYGIAWVYLIRGYLELDCAALAAAERTLTEGVAYASERWGERAPISALMMVLLSAVYYETDRIGLASATVSAGADMIDQMRTVELATFGFRVQTGLSCLWGAPQAALERLDDGRANADTMQQPRLHLYLDVLALRLLLRLQRVNEARELHRGLRRETREYAETLLVREADALIAMVDAKPARALALWGELAAIAARLERPGMQADALARRALVAWRGGDANPALRDFDAALRVCREHGLVRVIADEAALLRPLLLGWRDAQAGRCAEHDARVLAACGVSADPEPGGIAVAAEPAPPATVALSDKECAMLRLVAAGLSNREIAERVFLAEPTVKWHLRNAYAKLGVRSRTAALARARALGALA